MSQTTTILRLSYHEEEGHAICVIDTVSLPDYSLREYHRDLDIRLTRQTAPCAVCSLISQTQALHIETHNNSCSALTPSQTEHTKISQTVSLKNTYTTPFRGPPTQI